MPSIRRRFFKRVPRYIALQELNGEGQYKAARASSVDLASGDSEASTPRLKKRMTLAILTRRHSNVSLSSNQRKRASIYRAFSATKDIFASSAISHRSSHNSDASDASDADETADEPNEAMEKLDKEKPIWVKCWTSTPSNLGPVYTHRHSTLFVPFST